MNKKVLEHFEKILKAEKTIGPNKNCEYYPCHFEKQDCSYCFCFFYPCNDNITGGKFTLGKVSKRIVWSCENCNWIHRQRVAKRVFNEVKEIILQPEDVEIKHKKLLKIRQKILNYD